MTAPNPPDRASASSPLSLPLGSPSSTPSLAGGKGHNLSILVRGARGSGGGENESGGGAGGAGDEEEVVLRVPPGFVVTSAAYRAFLDGDDDDGDGGLRAAIDAGMAPLLASSSSAANPSAADLEGASTRIRSAFRDRRLPDALRSEVAGRLSDLLHSRHSDDRAEEATSFVAVRSSATCEDSAEASFAGQHDTYLNVPARVDDVCDAITNCFSSLYAARAISYRLRRGGEGGSIPEEESDVAMAAVVQSMAPSQSSSGVLFTANPLTGRRSESVLEAVPGLGEALVSGLTEPDRYVVRHGADGAVDVKDRRTGAKAKAVPAKEGGGVEEVDEAREEPRGEGGGRRSIGEADEDTPLLPATVEEPSAVLTDAHVARIVRLGRTIQSIFDGAPQDVEWAMSDDGRIYVVQSRPITAMFPLPDVPAEPLQVFFSFNAVQGIVAPIYPAGQDVIRTHLLGGLIRWITWGRHGHEGTFMQTVAGRLYGNFTNILRNSVGRKILMKIVPAIESGVAAALEELRDEPDLSVTGGAGPRFFLRALSLASTVLPRYLFSILFPDWSRRRLVRRIDDHLGRIERKAAAADGLSDVIALQREALSSFFPTIVPHFLPRMAAAMHPLALLAKLASSVPEGNDLALTITRGMPHNVTTMMDLELWQVAKAIRDDPASLAHFRSYDADILSDEYLREQLPSPAQRAVRGFMAEYGMRGLYEIDFGRPRWREDPAPLMNTLRSYVEIPDDCAPDRVFDAGEVAAEEASRELGRRLGKPRLVSFLVRRIRSLAGLRELPKFTIIRIMGFLREKMLIEGSKLAKAGTLDDARDVFFLSLDELECLSKGELIGCKRIVRDRKAFMGRESERTRIPRLIASDGFTHYGGLVLNQDTGDGSTDAVLRGEPVSPGTYEGRVQVVHDPREARLSPGSVLCCHGTDPSWTPLFLSAGALVMEVGGLMTHGSVVAREYGIPAVVGLDKVTERLSTGQLVRVNGSSGVVEILDEKEQNEETCALEPPQ